MKTLYKIILSSFIVAFPLQKTCLAIDVNSFPDEMKVAIYNGNARELSKYFNSSVELDLLGKEGVYSKLQAEQIVKDFFTKHPVKNFSVLFEGGKDSSQYAVGKLITSNGIFRVNLLFKGQVILQLRIEEDNGS